MTLLPLPHAGRRYSIERRVLLSDTTPQGRLRLDALARVLHDVATLDNTDAPLADKGLWVIRSIDLDVATWPRYLDELEVTTAVSGTGRAWAERRTDITVAGRTVVAAATLWVNTNPSTGAPASLPAGFDEVYGAAAAGRHVRPSLVLHEPTAAPELVIHLDVRLSDLDIVDHVNNAVHLAFVEEALWRGQIAHATLEPSCQLRIEFRRSLPRGPRATVTLYRADDVVITVGDDDGVSSIARVTRSNLATSLPAT